MFCCWNQKVNNKNDVKSRASPLPDPILSPLDDSVSRACLLCLRACPVYKTKRYVSTRGITKPFFLFQFASLPRALSKWISQQGTDSTVKPAEYLAITTKKFNFDKCVLKKIVFLIAIWRFLVQSVLLSATKVIWDLRWNVESRSWSKPKWRENVWLTFCE